MFRCDVCCLLLNEEVDVCPRCWAKKENIKKLEADQEKKVIAADRTNTLLASLVRICDELKVVAEEGKEINLDPGCYGVFTFTLDKLDEIKRYAKAEIEVHINRNKW